MIWQLLVCSGSIATNGMAVCAVWELKALHYQTTKK